MPNLALASYFAQEQKIFDVDLQGLSLIECIERFQEFKLKISEKASRSYECLKKHVRDLEEEYKVTILPQHITDVF